VRLLIIHNEAEYFAGAEKMLGYFLQALATSSEAISMACVKQSKIPSLVPPGMELLNLERNQPFSSTTFIRQVAALVPHCRKHRYGAVHAWAARDWELAVALGFLAGIPVVGTLHDHPQAPFISRNRQRLMRACARHGLRKVACVSEAVRLACQDAGYPSNKLEVIHNGLPPVPARPDLDAPRGSEVTLGFLGNFVERKGLPDLFALLEELHRICRVPWKCRIAGGAQDSAGETMVLKLKKRYEPTAWWPRVEWVGWTDNPFGFLSSIDLLIFPSSTFDPFPTVLLEAGAVGVPVLATRVGGAAEIVVDQETGWFMGPGHWAEGAKTLAALLQNPASIRAAGRQAVHRLKSVFSSDKMVVSYRNLYAKVKVQ